MAMWPDLASQFGGQVGKSPPAQTLAQITQPTSTTTSPYSAPRQYTMDNPQTLSEFMDKYKTAISADGKFIPGKANLEYDDLNAADVYKMKIGGYSLPGWTDDNGVEVGLGTYIAPQAEVNADWIEDPRAKGWIGQHPGGTKMLAAIAAMVGGGALLGAEAGGTALAGSEAGMLTGGVGGEAFATNAAYDAAMQQAIAAGTVGAASSGLGSGFSGATSGLGSGLSDLGFVDGAAPILGNTPPMSMSQALGMGAEGTGTLGGATNAAGQLIGNGSAAGSYTAGFADSAVGKLLGNLGGDGALSTASKLASGAGSLTSGLGGIRDIAQAAGTIWSAGKGSENATNNQSSINGQIKTLTDMFGQDSPYAKMLRQTLERKDAAAGRNSQYGNRETQLQALLAEKALQSSGVIGDLAKQSSSLDNSVNAGRNTQLNALDSILNKTGVYDWTTDWMKQGLGSLFGD